jgi:hypothetical protein
MEQISKPSELLGLMASTSTQINVFSDSIIQAVQGGELNPLDVAVQLKAMELASERIRKETKVELLNEVSKYPEKSFTYNGNTITKAEHGTKYCFDKCGDPEWEMLNQQKESIARSMKEREEFLKALKSPIEVLNSLSGEIHLLTPPTKTSVSGINISIK